MNRIVAAFVVFGLILATTNGCSERIVEAEGVCAYQWYPGPPGSKLPSAEPCSELVVEAKRLTDGRIFKETTDREGRFKFHLPPAKYQFSVVGCPKAHSRAIPPQPIVVEIPKPAADDLRLIFVELGV